MDREAWLSTVHGVAELDTVDRLKLSFSLYTHTNTYIHTYICVCVYIYIYIYLQRGLQYTCDTNHPKFFMSVVLSSKDQL